MIQEIAKRKKNLLLCLPIAPHERQQASELASLWADLEPTFNPNVTVLIATRFDLNVDEAIDPSIIFRLKQKFTVIFKRIERVGTGWPAGCNALEIGAYEWFVEQNRSGKIDFEYMLFAEADTVPLRKTWLTEIIDEAYASGSLIIGAYFTREDGCQHINGNCVIHRDFWKSCKSIWLCPSNVGWDCHIGVKSTEIGHASRLIWQDYRLGTQDNPWRGDDYLFDFKIHRNQSNPLFGISLRPAMVHGCKTLDAVKAVRRRVLNNA